MTTGFETTSTAADTTSADSPGDLRWIRIGGLLGVGFVVVQIAKSFGRPETPLFDDPVEEIRAYWEADGTTYLVGQYLGALAGVMLFIPFLIAVTTMLGRANSKARLLARAALIGGVLQIGLLLAADAAWATLGSAADQLSDDALVTLTYLDRGAYSALGFTLGLFVAATSLAILQAGVLWRWLGYVGVAIAAAALLAPLGIVTNDSEGPLVVLQFIVGLTSMLWLLLTGIATARSTHPMHATA